MPERQREEVPEAAVERLREENARLRAERDDFKGGYEQQEALAREGGASA